MEHVWDDCQMPMRLAQRSQGNRCITSTVHLPILLAGVMRLVRLGFGRFFRRRFLRLEPFGVENPRLIDALVSVGTEEIALRLQEIRRQTRGAITIVVSQ